jgi:hypothetical protein
MAALVLLLAVVGMVLASLGTFAGEPAGERSRAGGASEPGAAQGGEASRSRVSAAPSSGLSGPGAAAMASAGGAPGSAPSSDRAGPGATAAPAAAVEKLPEMMEVHVTSEPPGASVYLEGALVGPTPLVLPRPRNSGELELTLKLKGFEDKVERVATILPRLDVQAVLVRPKRATGGPANAVRVAPAKRSDGFGTW